MDETRLNELAAWYGSGGPAEATDILSEQWQRDDALELLAEVRRLRELLRGVAETFDGVDPVGPPLREAIRDALS